MKSIRSWVDPTTRREVHQLTNCPNGAMLDYFRLLKQLADGRILALAKNNPGGEMLAIDTDSGDVEPLPIALDGARARLQVGGQRLWIFRPDREVWSADLPRVLARLLLGEGTAREDRRVIDESQIMPGKGKSEVRESEMSRVIDLAPAGWVLLWLLLLVERWLSFKKPK